MEDDTVNHGLKKNQGYVITVAVHAAVSFLVYKDASWLAG